MSRKKNKNLKLILKGKINLPKIKTPSLDMFLEAKNKVDNYFLNFKKNREKERKNALKKKKDRRKKRADQAKKTRTKGTFR